MEAVSLEDKSIKTARVTSTGVVVNEPCFIYALIVAHSSTDAEYVEVFDDFHDGGKKEMVVRTTTITTIPIIFHTPLYMSRCLHLFLLGSGCDVCVQYKLANAEQKD